MQKTLDMTSVTLALEQVNKTLRIAGRGCRTLTYIQSAAV